MSLTSRGEVLAGDISLGFINVFYWEVEAEQSFIHSFTIEYLLYAIKTTNKINKSFHWEVQGR